MEPGQGVQKPAVRYLPARQPVQSDRWTVPVPEVRCAAGQSRQEVEAGVGWYWEMGHEVQNPRLPARYLPAGQAVQPEVLATTTAELYPELPSLR